MKRAKRLLLGCVMLAAVARAETWIKVVAPKFTLYSNAASDEALAAANEFQPFIGALGELLPMDPKALPPLSIVLLRREKDFKPYRPLAPNGKPRDVAGFFSRLPSWAVFGLSGPELDDDLRRTIQHEGVHWFLSGYDVPNPPWLEEGLAEVFSTFAITKKGQAEWGRGIPEHAVLLQTKEPLPLKRLLAVSSGDPLFNENLRTGLFYAGSWAFVHYMLFSEQARTQPLFEAYMKAFRSGMHPDEAFGAAFGAGYERMDKVLAHYTRSGRYFVGNRPLPPASVVLRAEAADDFEREVALARLALGSNLSGLAIGHAQAAAKLRADSPVPHELLGVAAGIAGDADALEAAYREAARLKTRDHTVYYTLARSIQASGQNAATRLVQLTPEQAREAADHFEMTINCRRTFLPAFQGLGQVINMCQNFGPEDRRFLEFGLRQYPADGDIRIGLAVLDRKQGYKEEALRKIEQLLKDEPAPHTARYASVLLHAWRGQDRLEQIAQLAETGSLEKAVELIDTALAGELEPTERNMLLQHRRGLAAESLFVQTRNALDAGQPVQAKAWLEAVMASDATEAAKRRAQKWLKAIEEKAK